jgi:hypothetical protein
MPAACLSFGLLGKRMGLYLIDGWDYPPLPKQLLQREVTDPYRPNFSRFIQVFQGLLHKGK